VHSGGNGSGAAPAGRGLRNVTGRIASVGGKVSIRSALGAGTTIEGAVALPRERSLLDQVRKFVREVRELYDTTAERARLRGIQAQLNSSPGIGTANPADHLRRSDALRVRSALREVDAVLRSSPLAADQANRLRYQLEQIHSEAQELSEIDLLDVLRSGTLPLTSDERQVAEGLLGATGAQPWSRLGLQADTDPCEVRQAAERQLELWQRRASHPASTRAIRDAAEILVRTCEELLTQVGAPRAG
jgi:hypothetical protein